jgi:hypothetical protein
VYDVGSSNSQVNSLTVGDALGNGQASIVAGLSDGIAILPGNGSGTFGQRLRVPWAAEPHGPGIGGIAIGHLERGGKPDLVVAAGELQVMLGLGGNRFAPTRKYRIDNPGTGLSSVALGDLGGPGRLDLVAGEGQGAGGIVVLRVRPDGTLGAPRPYRTGSGPELVALGELSGGHKLDVATANQGSDDVSVLLNDGHGVLSGPTLNDDLYLRDSIGTQQLAADAPIDPGSLLFRGSTLYWTAGGTREHAPA